ncbi:MAG: acyl-CoA dehydrogenase family protein [Rhodoferax sp.]
MEALFAAFRSARIPAHAEAFRGEVRAFLQTQWTPPAAEVRARSWMGFDRDFSRRLAQRGWVGVTLPRAFGGAELDPFCRFVLVEELLAAGAPVGAHWIADRQSGPLLWKFGSEAQHQRYLPGICAGELVFCIGMSEPNAGSDLASVGTRATPDPATGGWRLNGRKIWTTQAHRGDYMIALVRSSGSAEDRHKGLSQFIIDLKAPGVTTRPIVDLTGDAHFSEVFFDDVALGPDALVGREGDGWMQVNAELAFERSGPERIYSSLVLLEHWLQVLRRGGDGRRHAAALGSLVAHLATLRRMSVAVTARLAAGESPLIEAALFKDLGTELEQAIPAVVEAAASADPTIDPDAELLRTAAYLSCVAPTYSLRGGTREILRGMIARGLGLR